VEHTRRLLEAVGLEGQRLEMTNLSSAMGKQFADKAVDFTNQIRRLGPSPLRRSGPPDPGAGSREGPEPAGLGATGPQGDTS
jgi:hypothetical protein